MAVTCIWKIQSRLDKVLAYITNEEKTKNDLYGLSYKNIHNLSEYMGADYKTEKQYYVSGINCLKETAYEEMMITKKQYLKEDGIQGFHIIQSFKEGETTPELAHKIGVELAEELFGDRFEVVVSTHLNTNHYHNHIVINSVSFKDGKRYYDNYSSYALLRKTSDLICEEHNLSVIPTTKAKIDYEKIYNGQVVRSNYYITTKEDINKAIEQASSYRNFIDILKIMGYEVFFRNGKISLRRHPYKRNIRIQRAFGEEYSIDKIKKRILETYIKSVPFQNEYSKRKNNYRGEKLKNKTKPKGIYRLFLYYCYLLKVFQKRKLNKYISPELKAEIKQMDKYSKEARLLGSNKIETTEQLSFYRNNLSDKISNLKAKREDLYYEIKRKNGINKVEMQNQITILSRQIKELKSKEMMCDDIKKRIPMIKEQIKNQEQYSERGKSKNEYAK